MDNQSNIDDRITKNAVVDTSPKVVFRALVDEKELQQWGPPNQRATLEQRKGGIVQFVTFREDTKETYVIRGRVLETIPEKKLSYTWNVDAESSRPETVVTWTLEPDGDNKTSVTLEHTGPMSEEFKRQASGGWSYFMDRLVKYCNQRK
jgi:uncharacterized protein YndB with AHSA1/START domain